MPAKGVMPPQLAKFHQYLAHTINTRGGFRDTAHFTDAVRKEFHATPGPRTFQSWNQARDRVAKAATGLHWKGLNKAAARLYHKEN